MSDRKKKNFPLLFFPILEAPRLISTLLLHFFNPDQIQRQGKQSTCKLYLGFALIFFFKYKYIIFINSTITYWIYLDRPRVNYCPFSGFSTFQRFWNFSAVLALFSGFSDFSTFQRFITFKRFQHFLAVLALFSDVSTFLRF